MSLILKEIIFAESFYFVKCFLNFLHFLHFPAFLFQGKFDEMSLFCIFSGIFFFVKFNYSPFTEAAFVFSISLERGKRYVFSFYLFTFVCPHYRVISFFFSPSFLPFFFLSDFVENRNFSALHQILSKLLSFSESFFFFFPRYGNFYSKF